MRRLVVIFLIFLLPTQVLAESLTDLSYDATCLSWQVAKATAPQAQSATPKPLPVVLTDSSLSQPMEHADIHDLLHSASYPSYLTLPLVSYSRYQLINQPLNYPPLRKPPRL